MIRHATSTDRPEPRERPNDEYAVLTEVPRERRRNDAADQSGLRP